MEHIFWFEIDTDNKSFEFSFGGNNPMFPKPRCEMVITYQISSNRLFSGITSLTWLGSSPGSGEKKKYWDTAGAAVDQRDNMNS